MVVLDGCTYRKGRMNDTEKVAAIREILDGFVDRDAHGLTVHDHLYFDTRFLEDLFNILDRADYSDPGTRRTKVGKHFRNNHPDPVCRRTDAEGRICHGQNGQHLYTCPDFGAEAGGIAPPESITVQEDLGGPYPRWKRAVLDLYPDGTVRWRRSKFDAYYDGNMSALRTEQAELPITEQLTRGFVPFEGDEGPESGEVPRGD